FDVVKEGESAPPALTVRVCVSIACELANASDLLEGLPGALGKNVRVLHAPCVGRCEVAPCVVVGQNPIGNATIESVRTAALAKNLTCQTPRYIDHAAYQKAGGYKLLAECHAGRRQRSEITQMMEDSGLRGLGGAGFPIGRKWKIVAAEAEPRLMAVNIDEGEPGTFKDRWYLERDPHRFLEGMLVAAWAVGIAEIYIYLRDEYAGCRAILEKELAALERNPPCDLPPIHRGAGGGRALGGGGGGMRMSWGARGGPRRRRPPYVAQVGLFGRPTLEHNMESVYWVREIVEKGPQWFAGHGRNG